MPPTYGGYTPTPANANLDTLPQLAGVLGALPANVVAALAAFNVIPVVASAAARDGLIPAPVANMRVQRSDTGLQERYDGAGWRAEGVLRSAGPVVATTAKAGFVGDGVNDDSVALASADAAAVASGGRQELDLSVAPTRVLVNSNLTLNAHFRPNAGARRIYVGAGKTLTIAGGFDPGLYGVFDPTMPGNVVFTSKAIPRYHVQWFGVVGDTVTNDTPALTFMKACLPKHCEVLLSPNLQMLLGSNWNVYQLPYVRFYTPSWLLDAAPSDGSASFIWGGAAGGTMVTLDRCRYTGFEGIMFRSGSANVCLDLDMIAAGSQISTQNYARRCQFYLEQNNPNWVGLRIANVSGSNCEYNRIEYNQFYGYGDRLGMNSHGFNDTPAETCTTVAGTPNVTFAAGLAAGLSGGVRLRIAGAGTPIAGFASGWDAVVQSVTDSTHAVMTTNAPTSVAGAYSFAGQGIGTGVSIGASYNAKGTRFRRNTFQWLNIAINCAGGSLNSDTDNFTGNEINYWIHGSQSEPSFIYNVNSENSRCFIKNDSNETVTIKGSRTAPNWIDPINGHIQLASGAILVVEGCEIDNYGGVFPANTRLFDARTNAGQLLTMGNSFPHGVTWLGWDQFDPTGGGANGNLYVHTSIHDITAIPGRHLIKVRGGGWAASNDYANSVLGGRTTIELPESNDDTQLTSVAPFGSSLGAGSMSHRLLTQSAIANTGIIERRVKRMDGSVGSALLPVDTTDVTYNAGAVRNVTLNDFGRRWLVDASAATRQPQLFDSLPVGFWLDVVRMDAAATPANRVNIILSSAGTINGINGVTAGVDVNGQGTTLRLIKRAAGTWDAIPLAIMPVVAAAGAGITGLIANGAQGSMTLTVGGARVGNHVDPDVSVGRQKLILQADVTAADTVTIVATNQTGAGVTLGACNVLVRVHSYV